MGTVIRETRSVCPVCLKNLPAALVKGADGRILLEKRCPEHGAFSVPVWQGAVNFDAWIAGTPALTREAGTTCPGHCGLCASHESGSCCVLLEITRRCNLRCRFCFADGGAQAEDPPLEELKTDIADIAEKCGRPLLQLSGGEPTLRDDLPELVRFAKEAGCSFVQLNTNGLRLAREPEVAGALAAAGLDIVFLQFDGTKNEIYETLRGAPLLEEKLEAVRICAENHIGVTLVPTVVQGVNDGDLGALVHLAASLAPGVRGVHFQPVSYFGRYPKGAAGEGRYTLDRLMADLSVQAEIPIESFLPSRCDHPLCGFHANYLIDDRGGLTPLGGARNAPGSRSCAGENREYIARHWKSAPPEPEKKPAALSDAMDFDTFLYRLRHQSLLLTSMAFQDAMNLNIERLRRCSLHVYEKGKVLPFCTKYLTSI